MSITRHATRTQQAGEKPKRYVFVLLNNFTLLCFAAALESLRIANRMAEREIYSWRIIGEGGDVAYCSAGTGFKLDGDLDEVNREDTIMLCGGIDVQAATSKKLLGWLRREARKGPPVAGLCTAAFTLAKAGLLDGKRATIHWENQDSFAEEFPDVELTKSVFVVDDKRLTTAGGTSSIDLMLQLIADDNDEQLANAVADQLIYAHPHRCAPSQVEPGHSDHGTKHRRADQPFDPGQGCGHVHPPAGTPVSPVSEPQPQAVLHGIAPAKGAQSADADGYERDQCRTGLRLCQPIAFFEMLPRPL
jgi:transcriptional regulator GlxA family with amidase domain